MKMDKNDPVPASHQYPAFSTEMRRSADGETISPLGVSIHEYLFGRVLQGICSNSAIFRDYWEYDGEHNVPYERHVVRLANKIVTEVENGRL